MPESPKIKDITIRGRTQNVPLPTVSRIPTRHQPNTPQRKLHDKPRIPHPITKPDPIPEPEPETDEIPEELTE